MASRIALDRNASEVAEAASIMISRMIAAPSRRLRAPAEITARLSLREPASFSPSANVILTYSRQRLSWGRPEV